MSFPFPFTFLFSISGLLPRNDVVQLLSTNLSQPGFPSEGRGRTALFGTDGVEGQIMTDNDGTLVMNGQKLPGTPRSSAGVSQEGMGQARVR